MCLKQDPLRSFFITANGFVVYFVFAFNYPSLKQQVESKGVSQSWTGIILGIYSLPSLFYWLFFDKLVNRYGRKCILLSGLYLFLISLFLFGLIEFATAPFFFVFSALITRFLLGMGSYQHKTVLYSVATKKYPESINKIYSYISMGINLGIGLAGFMGSITYKSLNQNLFYINSLFAALLLAVSAPMTHYLLTEPKISKQSSKKSIARVDTIVTEKTISLKFLLNDCKILIHFLAIFWYTVIQNFWMTSLRKSLVQGLNSSETFIALTYLTPGICSFLITSFVPWIISRCGRPNTVIAGATLGLIGFVFFGPLQFLPYKAYFIIIGAAFQGFGYPLLYIPTIPEIIHTVIAKHQNIFLGPVTDKASSIAYLCMDTGAIIGTIAGDLSYNAFGFRRMVLLFALLHLFVLILFGMFGKTGRPCRSSFQKIRHKIEQTESTPSSARKLENED